MRKAVNFIWQTMIFIWVGFLVVTFLFLMMFMGILFAFLEKARILFRRRLLL
tara:strand:- start:8699 stop:8854 length:156 start_codon:yes stop_codon:yes gene_type:complete